MQLKKRHENIFLLNDGKFIFTSHSYTVAVPNIVLDIEQYLLVPLENILCKIRSVLSSSSIFNGQLTARMTLNWAPQCDAFLCNMHMPLRMSFKKNKCQINFHNKCLNHHNVWHKCFHFYILLYICSSFMMKML